MDQDEKSKRFRAAIAVGLEEFERGEVVEFTPELLAEIDREADRMLAEGEAPDPDVCP